MNKTFLYNVPDWTGDEWNETTGFDEQDAAINVAKRYDRDDYNMARGTELQVFIKDVESGVVTEFNCYAEPYIEYYAREVKKV